MSKADVGESSLSAGFVVGRNIIELILEVLENSNSLFIGIFPLSGDGVVEPSSRINISGVLIVSNFDVGTVGNGGAADGVFGHVERKTVIIVVAGH